MFRVLQWNMNGYINNYNELTLLIQEYGPDVICLQETHISYNINPNIIPKGYYGYFHNLNNTSSKQGIAFLIKQQISHTLPSNHNNILSSTLQINLNTPLLIINTYLPPQQQFSILQLSSLINNSNSQILFLGDFNSWSPLWGSKFGNKRGTLLEDFIFKENLILLNDGSPTHFSTHSSFTNVDLTLCSTHLHSKCSWKILNDLCGSDHFPIFTNVNYNFSFNKFIPSRKFKTDQANWQVFSNLCETFFNKWSFQNVNHEVAMISKAIRSAANISIPQTNSRPIKGRKCWWNSELDRLRSDKIVLWKIFKRNRSTPNLINFKKANALFKRRVKVIKRDCYEKFTSSISRSSSIGQLCSKLNSITRSRPCPIQTIVYDNHVLNSPELISEAFAKTHATNSSDSNFTAQYRQNKISALTNLIFDNNVSTDAKRTEVPILSSELECALRSAKGKTPGLDRISYPMLKNLPPVAKQKILNLYNNIFNTGIFPHM